MTRESLGVDDSLLESAAQCLDAESVRALGELRLADAAKLRLHLLAEKANEGRLTAEEAHEYDRFIELGCCLLGGMGVAAFIMAADRWNAGGAFMKAQDPQTRQSLSDALKLTGDNQGALAACREAAGKAKKEQRCSIVVSAPRSIEELMMRHVVSPIKFPRITNVAEK